VIAPGLIEGRQRTVSVSNGGGGLERRSKAEPAQRELERRLVFPSRAISNPIDPRSSIPRYLELGAERRRIHERAKERRQRRENLEGVVSKKERVESRRKRASHSKAPWEERSDSKAAASVGVSRDPC